MTHQNAGSICSPGGWTRAPARAAAILVVGLAVLLAGQPGSARRAAYADDTQNGIFCGVPLARHLAADSVDTFNTSLLPGTVVSSDVVPATGLLQMQSVNFTPMTQTCQVDLVLRVPPPPPDMEPAPSMINVSGCLDSAEHDYTITLSVVSAGPDNCAVPLPCGTPYSTDFAIPGEVDSYAVPGTAGDQISLRVATGANPDTGQVRIRLFDPSGVNIADDAAVCPGRLSMQLPTSGTYTVLISPCSGAKSFPYTVTLQAPSCTARQPPGQYAYVTNADSGTMSVVDLASNTTRLVTPITPLGRAALASPTFVAITPNGGFAWATYDTASTTSVVNSSTNILTASVPTGLAVNGVAFCPDGATAYIVANGLGGIALVDTRTNKVTRVVAQDVGFAQGIACVDTPGGRFLYVMSDDGLVKINAQDYMTVAVTTLNLGFYDAFAASPDGTYVYAGVADGIVRIDTTSNVATDSISGLSGEPFAIAFTPDGGTAYATIADNSMVAVIHTATNHAFDTISNVGDSPSGIAINPDTLLAYVTDFTASSTDPGLFVVDTKTNKVIDSLPTLGDGPTAIALTTAPTGLCVGDAHGQTEVTIDELVLSVNYSLNGCPGQFPPMSVPFP